MATKTNFLIFMVDQLSGTLFPDGPADWMHAPNLNRLAESSVRFNSAYTPFPLCAPARAAFMSGRLPSRIGVFDNAAEFGSDIPTFAHLFRRAGYCTCLSGKMHFVGADQLHGFEERLTTDIYPADYGWTPDYRRPGERIDWWYHNLGSVKSAGIAETTHQLEYDDEVTHHAVRRVHEFGRGGDERPWMLVVSFTHPHDPYVARRQYWDLQRDGDHLRPETGAIDHESQDPHSQRIFDANDWRSHELTEDNVVRSRRGHFANISYIDDRIGDVLRAVEAMRLTDRTVVMFLADHGDMLGERGLWFKMHFFEGSARVPLMISGPGIKPRSVGEPVSLIDLAATMAELAGLPAGDFGRLSDGRSLVPEMEGRSGGRPVLLEYSAEASIAPLVAVRDGSMKFIHCTADPPMLFDLGTDPRELNNLAGLPEHAGAQRHLAGIAAEQWDLEAFDAAVRRSQESRLLVYGALRNGHYYPWDHQPLQKASERYMRNHMDLNELEVSSRFPRDPGD